MEEQTFSVPGMTCGHCKMAISQAVGRLTGVSAVDVDLGAKKVTVRYNTTAVDETKIREAIEDAGYDVK